MLRPTPESKRIDTPFPYTTRFRSVVRILATVASSNRTFRQAANDRYRHFGDPYWRAALVGSGIDCGRRIERNGLQRVRPAWIFRPLTGPGSNWAAFYESHSLM